MPFTPLAPDLWISPQLTEADVQDAAAQGFKTIINNRPDGEEPGQPTSATLQAVAQGLGLAFQHIPVTPGNYSDDDVAAERQALVDLPGPALGFCRTGARASHLWALAHAGARPARDLLAAAETAGVDFSAIADRLGDGR